MKNLKYIILFFLAIPSIGISQYVFSSNQELKDAVDMYVNYPSIGLDTYGEINTWDVSAITDMSELFKDHNTFNEQISNWNTSNVINMRYMFSGATSFNQNIGSWDTSNVVYMSGMFKDAHSFNQDIGNWNTSNVFDMDELFYYATSFNHDIRYWDTSIVRRMDHMFFYAESFNQDIANWNVINVTNMSDMFSSALSFNQDIGSWDTSNVNNMSSMFSNAISFNQDIGNWDTSNVFDMSSMFQNASSFNQNIGSWNVFNVDNMSFMFYRATNFDADISSWNVNNVIDVSLMFYDASSFNQDISNWDFNISSPLFFEDFLSNSGLSAANYSELIKKITQKYINGTYEIQYVEFGAENLKFCNPDYRQYMIDNFGWQFYDDGQYLASLNLLSPLSSTNQFICSGDEIQSIYYQNSGDSPNVQVIGLPEGTHWSYNSFHGELIIWGGVETNVNSETTYNYSVETVDDGCTEKIMMTGQITVYPNPEMIDSVSNANQEICEGESIDNIVYVSDDVIASIELTWNNQIPNGIYGQYDEINGQYIISGTPIGLTDSQEIYNYTLSVKNINDCESYSNGSIVVNKVPNLEIGNPFSLEGDSFDNYIGENSPPDNVLTNYNQTSNAWPFYSVNSDGDIWSGTEQHPSYDDGVKNYGKFIQLLQNQGANDLSYWDESSHSNDPFDRVVVIENVTPNTDYKVSFVHRTGIIYYDALYQPGGETFLQLQSMNSDFQISQTFTPDSSWSEESFNFTTDSETTQLAILFSAYDENNDISIHIDAITFNYQVSTANQEICEGDQLTDIVYNIDNATEILFNGLPPGVFGNFDFDNKVVTISGTPNQDIELDTQYSYTVKAINSIDGCESPELTGEITVKANAELTLLSSINSLNQTVCVDSNIENIAIRFKNSVPYVNNLPPGLYWEYVGADVIYIQGSVYYGGGGPHTIDVIGENNNGCISSQITIQLMVQPDYEIAPVKVVNDINNPNNGIDNSFVENISCYGNRDGEIMVNLSTFGSSYIYAWSGPNGYVNTTQSNHIKNLQPGNYTVSVYPQGNSSCPVTELFTIEEPVPFDITFNEIRDDSCTGPGDGLISLNVGGGNSSYYTNYFWEFLLRDENCVNYTLNIRDNDNDGIFDVIDADIDNDGSIDPGKLDENNDGIIDEFSGDYNYSLGSVYYQTCDGDFIENNILFGEISGVGTYQYCAKYNSITTDSNLDHDLDANTPNISFGVFDGGTVSCSSGVWQKMDELTTSTIANNLSGGLYRFTVVQGPDISYLGDGDLDSLYNDSDVCIASEIIEITCSTASANEYFKYINIYPNPTTSIINIEQDFTTAKVYDISGRELLKSTSKTIDLSEFPSSIYLLRLYDNSNRVLGTSKVVKQ